MNTSLLHTCLFSCGLLCCRFEIVLKSFSCEKFPHTHQTFFLHSNGPTTTVASLDLLTKNRTGDQLLPSVAAAVAAAIPLHRYRTPSLPSAFFLLRPKAPRTLLTRRFSSSPGCFCRQLAPHGNWFGCPPEIRFDARARIDSNCSLSITLTTLS